MLKAFFNAISLFLPFLTLGKLMPDLLNRKVLTLLAVIPLACLVLVGLDRAIRHEHVIPCFAGLMVSAGLVEYFLRD